MRGLCNFFDGGVCCHPEHGFEIGEVSGDFCDRCPYYRGDDDATDKTN
jgi:hypothetical protein